MKKRYIILGVILLIIVGIVSYNAYRSYVPGWGAAENEIKKEYPVVKKIKPQHAGGPTDLGIMVYLKAQTDQQEVENILDCMSAKLFTEEIMQGLTKFHHNRWRGDYFGLTVFFMYKNQQICRFDWNIIYDTWTVSYDNKSWEKYFPSPLTPTG